MGGLIAEAFYTNAHVVKSAVPEGFTVWYLASKTSTRSTSSWLGPVNRELRSSRVATLYGSHLCE